MIMFSYASVCVCLAVHAVRSEYPDLQTSFGKYKHFKYFKKIWIKCKYQSQAHRSNTTMELKIEEKYVVSYFRDSG